MKLQIRLRVKNHKLPFRGFSLAPSGDDFPPPFQTTLLPLGGQTPKKPLQVAAHKRNRRHVWIFCAILSRYNGAIEHKGANQGQVGERTVAEGKQKL